MQEKEWEEGSGMLERKEIKDLWEMDFMEGRGCRGEGI